MPQSQVAANRWNQEEEKKRNAQLLTVYEQRHDKTNKMAVRPAKT